MTDTIAALEALQDPERAQQMAAYHKADRRYLGISNPVLNELTRNWRREMTLENRATEAARLWASDTHEGRISAGKLLTQARIQNDDAVWALIKSWVPQFDAWAIADHACAAGSRRLLADPTRLDTVETWTASTHMWTKRAALIITLPWAKFSNPKLAEIAARERILSWAASYVSDPTWFIQKSIAWWIRDLSKHDATRARMFVDTHGSGMKNFARKEAAKYL